MASSEPKSILLQGDVDIVTHSNVSDGGDGSLKVASTLTVSSTVDSTSSTTGAVTFLGGVGIAKKVNIGTDLDVEGATTLDKTTIDTTDGAFEISGANGIAATPTGAINLTSGSGAVSLTSTASTLALTSSLGASIASSSSTVSLSGSDDISATSTAGRVVLSSAKASSDAIKLEATNAAGGITVTAKNGISLTSEKQFAISGSGVASSIALDTSGGSQDLTISLTGETSSRLAVQSQGTTSDALRFEATNGGYTSVVKLNETHTVTHGGFNFTGNNAASGFTLNTNNDNQDLSLTLTGDGTKDSSIVLTSAGSATDAIQLVSTYGGITNTAATRFEATVSAGPFVIDATGASSSITNTASNNGHNFSISQLGNYDARLIVTSTGTGVDAIYMNASAGGIDIDAIKKFDATVSSGFISLAATGNAASPVSSLLKHTSTSASQNFKLELAGAYNNSLQIYSDSTSTATAIDIRATAGGINVDAANKITIDTTDTSDGIQIGSASPGTPILIGNTLSEVTIGQNLTVNGDLTVSGTTTYVNSEIVTIQDNVFMLNSGPVASADSGIIARRYQVVDGTTGDVVTDTAALTGTAQANAGSQTATNIQLATNASTTNDFYKNYWIRITAGTGSGQIRKIKSYVGSTKVATIYGTGETDGLDWATQPDGTSQYALYANNFVATFYDESADEYVVGFCANDPGVSPGAISVTGKPQVHVGEIDVDRDITVDTINEHTTNAGVTVESVNFNSGSITGVQSINNNAVDVTENVTLQDSSNSGNGVEITAAATRGSFMFIVNSPSSNSCATFFVSKAVASANGQVNRLTSSRGINNDLINMVWNANEKPKLFYQIATGTGLPKVFRVKTITV